MTAKDWMDIFWAFVILGGYYLVAHQILPAITLALSEKHVNSTGLVSFFWWCLALPFFLLMMLIFLIYGIITLCCGISLANDMRDWWHKKD